MRLRRLASDRVASTCSAKSALLLVALALGGCAGNGAVAYLPLSGYDTTALHGWSTGAIDRRRLVALDLVVALQQWPGLSPAGTTLQVTMPKTVFGTLLIRALEDAGYGVQRVEADQGRHHVGYGERSATTNAGVVEDFTLSVGPITLSRAYRVEDGAIYPSSLMQASGVDALPPITLNEQLFRQQGGDLSFESGVEAPALALDRDVRVVRIVPGDAIARAEWLSADAAFADARHQVHVGRSIEGDDDIADSAPRVGRAVLVFDGENAQRLGMPNKLAIEDALTRYRPGDVFLLRGCHDADGRDAASSQRVMRVEDELLAHGVPSSAVRVGPCLRIGYRRAANGASGPVELLHFRPADDDTPTNG